MERYTRLVRGKALLSLSEEQALARRAAAGEVAAQKDLAAANVRLVLQIARRFWTLSASPEDLVSDGLCGLVLASHKYELGHDTKFATYASWWIRAHILHHILSHRRLVRLDTAEKNLFWKLQRAQLRLHKEGKDAAPEQIAQALGVDEDEVRDLQIRSSKDGETSLDHNVLCAQRLTCAGPRPDEILEQKEAAAERRRLLFGAVQKVAAELEHAAQKPCSHKSCQRQQCARARVAKLQRTARKVHVLRRRFLDFATQELIADELGLCRQRVQQIEAELLIEVQGYLPASG